MLIYVNCNDELNVKKSKEKIINFLADRIGYRPAEKTFESWLKNNDGFLFDSKIRNILFRKSRIQGFWKPEEENLNQYKIK